jgi:hypothetical protein
MLATAREEGGRLKEIEIFLERGKHPQSSIETEAEKAKILSSARQTTTSTLVPPSPPYSILMCPNFPC